MSVLAAFLAEEIASGSFPGGAALVASRDAVIEEAHAGMAAVLPAEAAVDAATQWDLASLTKPLAGGALAFSAMREGLDLSWSPGRLFDPWKRTRYDGITIEMLLTHTSGLPAWYPLYARGEGVVAYRRALGELEPEAKPGSAVVYSDLGMLLWTEILETFFGAPVDRTFSELVVRGSGSAARFLPETPGSCAATESDDATERAMAADLGIAYPRFRTGVVRGEVHDGNAFRRGGVSGHAGLFGTARDVWSLAAAWLDGARAGLTRDRTPDLSEARGITWQGSRGAGSVSPGSFSERAFGHTGFTGTSVWIEPDSERIFVLLTNRVHPRVSPGNFNAVRRRFHDRALRELPTR